MKILLDTCAFLWILSDAPDLSKDARSCFQDPSNDVFLSSVSVWEIMVKHGIGRIGLPEPPDRYVPRMRDLHGISPLALDEAAVLYLSRLPALHKDPFDRMLACQALSAGLVILTPDETLRQYPVSTQW